MEQSNKKLRLLVTKKCNNKCSLCCNNQFNLDNLPIVDRWDYDEIMITGGEPLLYPIYTYDLIMNIRNIQQYMGIISKIYIYTSKINETIGRLMNYYDGIVYTPHNSDDVKQFLIVNRLLCKIGKENLTTYSFRLNLFDNIHIPEATDLSLWQVKHIKWIKDCPIPEGEDFRRINNLWN